MPKQFSYGQSLLNAKGGGPVLPEKQEAAEPVNRTSIEKGLNVAAPSEPFGAGLAPEEGYEIPPAKELEFGGSGGGTPAAPVEQPPEDNPARQGQPQKLRPKPVEAAKVHSPHGGSGLEGYFDGEDGDGEEELEPSEPMAEPGSPDEYMEPDDADPEELARIEREQMEARIRAEVEAEYSSKSSGKKGKAGKTGGKQGRSVAYTGRGIKREDVETARLRNIPKCLVEVARAAFPDATRQEDAVAAYIYFREGMPKHLVVPDEIAELASKYSGENVTLGTVRDLVERDVLDLKVQNRELTRKLEAVELAIAYAIFEAAGFRKSDPTGPEAVDFLEHGIADLLRRLETQSELKRQRDRQREGRPIR